jgi:hypothetical protein
MTETKATYKLYELSSRLQELNDLIEDLDGLDIPGELHTEYLDILREAEETKDKFSQKIDSIVSLIQSRKRWLEVRKAEYNRLQLLIKKDEKTIEWLQEYLKQHLEKIGVTKLRTNKFNISVRKASTAPLRLLVEDAHKYPQQYQKITVEVDKKALKEAVQNGEPSALKYAELGEKSTYLSIK